ncbi:NADH-quinone oxidoreductase subunit C [Candidatus Hakubella thermalkaliphila]|uniref:NADH-quinone oxidoreductase subunit C n=1 Tax=Candidatus Hakubella thermalkaliphila TaxID=2754717 RepID=UPI001594CB3C|nr:NADH-quinone oxidoreductase subunit C [Candidatus Hakubella thermalkaliphila]
MKPGELYQNRTFSKDELTQALHRVLDGLPYTLEEKVGELFILIDGPIVLEVCRRLNQELKFDYLKGLTAADYNDYLEVIYCLYSFDNAYSLIVKAKIDALDPRVDSVISIWTGVDLQEREAAEMYGIDFVGHPNLKKLLLEEGFEGFPLRKSFQLPVDEK